MQMDMWNIQMWTVTEMTNLIDSSRSYEASATAFNAAKNIAAKGLELFNS